MINRFKEMLDAGIASFDYTPLVKTVPEDDPLCRMYNNIFSLATDTRMSVIPCDCGAECCNCPRRYAVTGSALMTDKWEKRTMLQWGNGVAIDYRPSGFWSISDFFWQNGLEGHREKINGDWAWVLQRNDNPEAAGEPSTPPVAKDPVRKAFSMLTNKMPERCPNHMHTASSDIPMPVTGVALKEDLDDIWAASENASQAADAMNKSRRVKGDHWAAIGESAVAGLIGNTVYIIGD